MTINYITKQEIQKTIMFFLTGGQTNKDVIYEKIVYSFNFIILNKVKKKSDLANFNVVTWYWS